MDFAFDEEQEMLREQARSYLAKRLPIDRVVELTDGEVGFDRESWREIAELGWVGLSESEQRGGTGMSFLEEAVLFEEMGRALYPGPYFSTVGLALPALTDESLARVVSGEAAATLAWQEPSTRLSLSDLGGMNTKAEQSNGRWKLSGEKHLVTDLGASEIIVVAADTNEGPALFEVDAPDARIETDSTMDSTRRVGRITLDGVGARPAVAPGSMNETIDRIRPRALAALALEAVGVAEHVLDLAREHAGERKQFGKPIGTYQAVSHQIANAYMETELARSLAYWAAWSVAERRERAPIAAAAAKAAASEAAVDACERSIQVHGGIGFTWEHSLHRYYKRAHAIAAFEGYGAVHRAAVAASLLD